MPVTVIKDELIVAKERGTKAWPYGFEEFTIRMRAETWRVVEVGASEYQRALAAPWGTDLIIIP